ncbi:LOG family protein [bacterium]|nr:LOG family protein [bacterium]
MGRAARRAPKAYNNLEFLNSSEARTVRILCEFLEPLKRFKENNIRGTVVFFGSSRILCEKEAKARLRQAEKKVASSGTRRRSLLAELRQAQDQVKMSRYYSEAVKLAREITLWSKTFADGKRYVVCSGGGPSIMEAANRGAREAGGKSLGLNISLPRAKQLPNKFISSGYEFDFHYFFMRKWWFFYLARALIVFPGGFGTMDELMEMLTLRQTGKIPHKFPVLLFGPSFWKKVVNFDFMVQMGVISRSDLRLFRFVDSAEEAFDYLKRTLPETKEALR